MQGLLSKATVTTVGLTCKAFLTLGFSSLQVNGLSILLTALEDTSRRLHGQGVVTVCNHISTLDDPVTWGVLPASYYLSSQKTRWALGASDIIFTNPVFSSFFHLGQTLEIFRGKGIYQSAVDTAIEKLNDGGWVHLYGEGKVVQPDSYPVNKDGIASLQRFKWGVGRIIMEASVAPVVIPMWITGFDKLMPAGRPFPHNYIPKLGKHLSVTFGDPIPAQKIKNMLHVQNRSGHNMQTAGWLGDEARRMAPHNTGSSLDSAVLRSNITAVIQREVEALGRSVSGNSLRGST